MFGGGVHESFIWAVGVGANSTSSYNNGFSWLGNYTIHDLPPGQYWVAASEHGASPYNFIPQPVSVFAGRALISKKVDEAVQRLKRLQELDPYAGPDEVIDKINRLVVEEIESREFIFWVSVLLVDRSIIGNRILAVSLRHQESARLVDSVQALVKRIKRLE